MSTHRRVYGLTGTLNQAESSVWRTDWDGSDVRYFWDALFVRADGQAGAYVSKEGAGAFDSIFKSGTNWVWTDGDSQYSELYDEANGGRITSRRDTQRDSSSNPVNIITYGYDASGRLNRVTTADGNFTDLVWDDTAGKTNNLLMLTTSYTDTVTSTTKHLTRTRYTYDASNRLQTVTVDLSPEHASGAAGTATADGRTYTTTYSYDGTSKRISSVIQTDGSRLDISYDGSNRVASFTQWVDTTTSRTTSFVYSSGYTSIADPSGSVTTLFYDATGQLTRIMAPAAIAGGTWQDQNFYYDSNGNLTHSSVSQGGTNYAAVWYRYDANGNLTAKLTGQQGGMYELVRYSYGGNNKLLSETSFTGLDPDGFDGVEPTGAMTTRYVYDEGENNGAKDDGSIYIGSDITDVAERHLRFSISPEGRVTEHRYNALGQTIATITYTVNSYSGTTTSDFTEKKLADWVNSTVDKTQAERTDFTYDFRGNLLTKTLYSRSQSSGAGDTNYDWSRTNYVYDQYGLLLSSMESGTAAGFYVPNPVAETYAYDGMGRVIRHTDSKGSGVWTSYIDTQNRTIVTLSNGLTTTSTYNRAGELVAQSEARGGLVQEELISSNLSTWQSNANLSPAGSMDGSDATQLLISSGNSYALTYAEAQISAGDSVTWTISLKAFGSATTQRLGLFGSASGWGHINWASARIISGPGNLVQDPTNGGQFSVEGLSNSESTRIELTRNALQDERITSFLYTYGATSSPGERIIVSGSKIIRSRYNSDIGEGSFISNNSDINTWASYNLSITNPTTLGGGTANTYTISAAGSALIYNSITAVAGDAVTTAMSYRATSSGNSVSFGIMGSVSGWGQPNNPLSSARIISGPGTLSQDSGGLWNITGLSETQETRVELVRTMQIPENVYVYVFPNRPAGYPVNSSLIIGAASILHTPGSATSFSYDTRGLLRVKTDPVGVKTYYVYDRAGRRTGEIDGDGSLTEYRYDAMNRVVAEVHYTSAVSAASLSALGNPLANNEVAGIRPASSSADRWSWNIYDKAGRLVQTIDAAGAIRQLSYDGVGRLTVDTRFSTALSSAIVSDFKDTPPSALILPPAFDDTADRRLFYYYDNDGQQIGMLDEDGYLTEYVYDKAGRKIESIRYAMQAGHNIAEASRPSHWRNATFATLKSTADDSPALDIHNYWLYDGRGFLGATIDGEGNVTRYHYSPRGEVLREVLGQQVTAAISYTLASLPAASGTLDVTNFTYDSRGQLVGRVRQLSGGTETTVWTYDSVGNRLTETTSENVSTETRAQSFRYDAKGRLIASMGGNGSAALAALGANPTQAQIDTIYATYGTRFVYDAAHRLIQKITPDGTGTTGNKTLYYYDGDGQLRYEINALGEVVETIYNKLEDRTETIAYATRISTSGLSGGLITATLSAVIASAAQNASQATTGGSTYDSRTQYSYTNRGALNTIYNPLYATAPTQSNYSQIGYNAFGEQSVAYLPTDTAASHWDISYSSYNRRGLAYERTRLLNGSATGAIFDQSKYDAYGNLSVNQARADGTHQSTYDYDRSNRQTYDYDAFGNHRFYSYDTRNNLISSRDRTGRTTTFAYDKFNRNVTTTTAEGIATTVKKNAYGQTIEITTPGAHFSDGLARTTRYTYDKNGNLDEVWEAWGTSQQRKITDNDYDYADRLTKVTDARGVVTTYSYDAAGRVLTETRDAGSGTRNVAGLPTTYANITTAYAYDAKGQQIQITSALGTAQQRVDLFLYDLKGQKTQIVVDSGGLNLRTDYAYRADGKVKTMTEGVGTPSARATAYEYDSMGRLLKTRIDPTGLNLTTELVYDVNDNVVAMKDESGFITRFVYDKENRQILSINAEGEVVETGYDAEGRAIWTRGYATRVSPDSWALEVAETTVRASLATDSAKDIINRTVYDRDGRKVFAVDGENYVTAFIYDGANNLTKTIRFAGKTNDTALALTTNAQGNLEGFDRTNPPGTAAVTSFTYDAANRLTSTTDAENYSEYYEYDAAGNRTKLTNKLGGITDYEYDALGRLRSEKVNAPVHDQNGNLLASSFYKSFFEYDAVGNVIRQVEGQLNYLNVGAAAESSAKVTSYSYDKANRLITKILPQVQEYDAASGGDTLVTPDEHYEYDARGNLILFTDGSDAKTFYYYDAANRKTVEISATKNATTGTYIKYAYDAHGNLKSRKVFGTDVTLPTSTIEPTPGEPSGEVRETQFDYDTLNRLTYTKTPNIRSGLFNSTNYVSTGLITLESRQEYDAFGNMVKETDANGNAIFHYYDRRGLETAKVDQENYLTRWERDQEGNVVEEIRFAAQLASAPTIQLVPTGAESADNRKTTFTYDKNGRRRFEVRHNLANVATVNAAGGGLTLASAVSNASIEYQYNALGQVVAKIEANADRTDYLYDNQGRMTSQRDAAITDHAGVTVRRRTTMNYDAQGNLVRTTEQGVDAVDNYASGYSPSTDRVTRYQYGAGGRLRTMTDATDVVTTYQYDRRGNIRRQSVATTKSDGTTPITIATINSYDIAGRQIGQYSTSTGLSDTPVQGIAYNAYGEVASKSVGGVTTEQFSYDLAGRVVRTNAGDGVWKFFVYDKNGNATLTLTARGQFSGSVTGGTDVSGYDQLAALNAVTGGAPSLALSSFTQTALLASVTEYDKRGMAIASHEPGREVAGSTQTISRSQSYNAFGETLSEIDARGNTTNYVYNTMGRVIQKIAPTVEATRENGTTVWIRPTEDYYYDIAGRMVAMRDAQDISETGVVGAGYANSGTSTAGAIKNDRGGHLTTRILLAGTGHAANGDEALVVKEYRPDSSDWESLYDAYRDLRVSKDGLDRATLQSFDKMGRVTQITRPETAAGTLIEYYSYDGLGQRIKSWNNGIGVTYQESRTDYDALGRVISQIAPGGDATTITYTWRSAVTDSWLGSFTGWEETTQYANGKTMVSKTDRWGREIAKTDMGARNWLYQYDGAGRMVLGGLADGVNSVHAANRTGYSYFNTGLTQSIQTIATIANGGTSNGTETYSYDANGNRLSEQGSNASGTYKSATASYDALNQMTNWAEAGNTTTTPAAWTATEYDAVGNIRRTKAGYATLSGTGGVSTAAPAVGGTPTKDYWYSYDAANRVVVDKGRFDTTSSKIVADFWGSSTTTYDAAGQRKTVTRKANLVRRDLWKYNSTSTGTRYFEYRDYETLYGGLPGYETGTWEKFTYEYFGTQTDRYEYDELGRLDEVYISQQDVVFSNGGPLSGGVQPPTGWAYITVGAMGAEQLRSDFAYDLVGRQIQQSDFDVRYNSGEGVGNYDGSLYLETVLSRSLTYNAKGQVSSDDVSTVRERYNNAFGLRDTYRSVTSYDYGSGVNYALGAVVSQSALNTKLVSNQQSWTSEPGTVTTTSYAWWDGAVQDSVSHDGDTGSSSNPVYTTDYILNGLGMLGGVDVNDGVAKTITYSNDTNGQIVRRDEARVGNTTQAAPHEIFYRFAGKQMGMVGNNGTADVGYDASIAERVTGRPEITSDNAGLFRNGLKSYPGGNYADFSQSIDPLNSNNQGSGHGTYTVRSGDTLQGIAAALYGDGNLWYRLAEANGLSGNTALSEGQSLILPAGVSKNTHNASTFMPYDASEAMGDTLPTTPKPPKKPKCGALGQILLIAIAAAVTAITAGANAPLLAQVGAAMLGSTVSQGVGVITGIQNKFSFKSVALAGLSAAVSAGLGKLSNIGMKTIDGVTINTATGFAKTLQGIGQFLNKATFLSDAVSGAVSSAITQGVASATGLQKGFSWTGVAAAGVGNAVGGAASRGLASAGVTGFGNQIGSTMADTIAQAATRSAIKGNSFGDNLLASLPSALGNLAGRALAAGIGTAFDGVSSTKAGRNATASSDTDVKGPQQTAGNAKAEVVKAESLAVTALWNVNVESGAMALADFAEYDGALIAQRRAKAQVIVGEEEVAISTGARVEAATGMDPQYHSPKTSIGYNGEIMTEGGTDSWPVFFRKSWHDDNLGYHMRQLHGSDPGMIAKLVAQGLVDDPLQYGSTLLSIAWAVDVAEQAALSDAKNSAGHLMDAAYLKALGDQVEGMTIPTVIDIPLPSLLEDSLMPAQLSFDRKALGRNIWNASLQSASNARTQIASERRMAAANAKAQQLAIANVRSQAERDLAGFSPLGVLYAWNDIRTQGRNAPLTSKIEAGASLLGPAGKLVRVIGGKILAKTAPIVAKINAAESRLIEGVDASTLLRSHSISGRASSRSVNAIADSMRSQGYVGDAIKVIESDGRMIIVDGHHRAAAAIRTGTPVNVQVIGPDAFPMGTGGWQSIDEVIQSSAGVGRNRLRPPGR